MSAEAKSVVYVLFIHLKLIFGSLADLRRYLFLFLKFMASIIPTIEYDYTMDFDMGSSS